MPKILNSKFYILIVILIIAAFLRLYNLAQLPPGLYPDEAMYGNNALEALSTADFKIFYPENNGREGLFMNIQAVFLKILLPLSGNNPEPWMLRLPSAIFGILTVLGIYFLAKELFHRNSILKTSDVPNNRTSDTPTFQINEKIALLSSFLLAISFWHINFSRIGFRAIMAPFFLVWGIYFLLVALRQIKEQEPSKFYILNSIFSGVFCGLGFYSYIAYRATPLLIFIILLLYWLKVNRETDAKLLAKLTRKKILLSIFYFLLSVAIVAAPLGIYFINNPQDFFGRTTQVSIFTSPTPLKDLGINILKTAGMFNFVGDWNWRHNYAGRPELFWPVGILFIIGLFLGIKSMFRTADVPNNKTSDVLKIKLPFIILFSWLIIAALPVVISNEGIPHALRAILMAPAVFILAGVGGVWLISRIKNYELGIMNNGGQKSKIVKFITRYSLFIILILLIVESYIAYFIIWGQNPHTAGAFNADYVRIGRELRELPKELPKYVVVEAGGVDVRGIPMPAQTVMFITDTFLPKKQKEKNIFYVLPNQVNQIPENSYLIVLK